jgi:predicted HicB family RNase H-like nuclease
VVKRIIQGVTYNTDTATKIATASWEGDDGNKLGTVYQTRGGAFFVDVETTAWAQDEDFGPMEKRVTHEFQPMSRDEAHEWILDGEVEVLADIFPDPPEATAEEEEDRVVTTTVYLRIPSILKRRIEAAAREANQSLNVWAIRCLENCSAKALAAVMPSTSP